MLLKQLASQVGCTVLFLVLSGIVALGLNAVLVSNMHVIIKSLAGGVLLLVSLNAIVLSLLLAFLTIKELFTRIRVDSSGIIVSRFGRQNRFDWSKLLSIRRASLSQDLPSFFGLNALYDRLHLDFVDGTSISIGPSCCVKQEIASIAEENVWAARITDVEKTLEEGGSVNFKTVTVSANGVTRNDKTIPWSTVRNVELRDLEMIRLDLEDGSHQSITISKMVNPGLFFRFVAKRLGSV